MPSNFLNTNMAAIKSVKCSPEMKAVILAMPVARSLCLIPFNCGLECFEPYFCVGLLNRLEPENSRPLNLEAELNLNLSPPSLL